MSKLTALLEEIEKLDAAASKEPWSLNNERKLLASVSSPAGYYADVWGPKEHVPAGGFALQDANFIARSRTLLPLLAKMLREAIETNEFYSSEETYWGKNNDPFDTDFAIEADHGKKARALKAKLDEMVRELN